MIQVKLTFGKHPASQFPIDLRKENNVLFITNLNEINEELDM